MSDDLYIGPTVLSPVRTNRGDRIGRWLVGPLALMLLVIVLLFYVFFTAHVISGDSMEPSLHNGDRTLVTRGYDTPRRGDIVVFTAIDEGGREEDIVKRVVGIPGDTVSVTGGVTTVNDRVEATRGFIPDPEDRLVVDPVVVPEDSLFVMGDNRPVSLDSRRIGFVPMSSVVGRVWYVWAPLGRVRTVR